MISRKHYQILADHADAIDKQSCLLDVEPKYHFAGDALYWPDERQARYSGKLDAVFRIVLRHRTELLLEKSEPRFLGYWVSAKQLFPNWVGFHESRTTPSPDLLKKYTELSSDALAYIKNILANQSD